MADVTVKYKGATLVEMSEEGTKTLKTSGKYCEDNISISYVPPSTGGETMEIRSKSYEFTLAQASGWVLLTTLDNDVLKHINDETLVVTLCCLDAYSYVFYGASFSMASNRQIGKGGNYPVYGVIMRQAAETTINALPVYYPANKTDTSTSIGNAAFRLDGNKYYGIPSDGFFRAGTYKLTFTW